MSKITIDLTKTVKEIITTMKKAIDSLQDQLTFDTTPTAGSSNPVTSDGIKKAITTGLASKQNTLTFDSTPTSNSSNPVTSGGVKTALDKKADTSSLKTVATSGSYNDLTDRPTIPTVPTKVSAFTNDAGYLTAHQSLSNYYTKTQVDTAISNAIASITDGDSNSY